MGWSLLVVLFALVFLASCLVLKKKITDPWGRMATAFTISLLVLPVVIWLFFLVLEVMF